MALDLRSQLVGKGRERIGGDDSAQLFAVGRATARQHIGRDDLAGGAFEALQHQGGVAAAAAEDGRQVARVEVLAEVEVEE